MSLITPTFRQAITGAGALAAALGLGGCGSFDSAASGNQLIRNYIKQYGAGQVSLSSVRCPSGIKQQTGASYSCPVTLHLTANRTNPSGEITIHMIAGNKVEIRGRQDVHIP